MGLNVNRFIVMNKKFLLNNLKTSKNINCGDIIPPKQVLSNCWFNTFFVTFFISDKGRKFFRYLRKSMITGILPNKEPIDKNMKQMRNISCHIHNSKPIKKFLTQCVLSKNAKYA